MGAIGEIVCRETFHTLACARKVKTECYFGNSNCTAGYRTRALSG